MPLSSTLQVKFRLASSQLLFIIAKGLSLVRCLVVKPFICDLMDMVDHGMMKILALAHHPCITHENLVMGWRAAFHDRQPMSGNT